jgi:CspA family cold shock protein
MEEQRIAGTVKWFSDQKGYGFIARDEGKDVFVHFSGIRPGGPRSLNEGDKVEFSIEMDVDLVVTESAPHQDFGRW